MKRYIRAGRVYYPLSERDKINCTRFTKKFEELLIDNGYTIHGYHEYYSDIAYKVEKDGFVIEQKFSKRSNPKSAFELIEDNLRIMKKWTKFEDNGAE